MINADPHHWTFSFLRMTQAKTGAANVALIIRERRDSLISLQLGRREAKRACVLLILLETEKTFRIIFSFAFYCLMHEASGHGCG